MIKSAFYILKDTFSNIQTYEFDASFAKEFYLNKQKHMFNFIKVQIGKAKNKVNVNHLIMIMHCR